MLNLSCNLGLITGASVMGAVFAFAVALSSAKVDITTAHPRAVAAGMRTTFAVAAIVILVALAIALANRVHEKRVAGGAQAK
jgi:hypothetical protein